MNRKVKFLVFVFTIAFIQSFAGFVYAQNSISERDSLNQKTKAIKFFKAQLALADTASSFDLLVEAKTPLKIDKIEKAINFLEVITEIPSSAEFTHAGRFKIPRDDYKKWKEWFCQNKQSLRWDSKEEKVVVIKKSQEEEN